MRKDLAGRALESAKMAADLRRITRARDEYVASEARKALAERMGRLRGLPQKLGQSLSLNEAEERSTYEPLTEAGDPLPIEDIEALLAVHWERPWQEVLCELDSKGLAASLGQVHRARLHDGREVAVKVAYPGIREAVMNDLKLLGWLGKAGQHMIAGFEMDAYRQVILGDLEEELDYRKEALLQARYAELNPPDGGVIVPQIFQAWSGEQVLVSQWLTGVTIDQASQWPEEARQALGDHLVAHFLHMFFRHGWLHADPHRGNYRFRSGAHGPQIILYDYGSVARFDKRRVSLLLRLILSATRSMGDPLPMLVGLGFKQELLSPIAEKLPALCQVLFEPFLYEGRFPHQDWQRGARIADILGDDRWNFRLSGPPDLMFLVRGFQGVFYYLTRLGVTVAWKHVFQRITASEIAEALTVPLPKLDGGADFSGLAKKLHIRLTEAGAQKVALSFPASSVERLETLMGDQVLARARAAGIDLAEVIKRARRGGYQPGELFSMNEVNRTLRVWLA